jgi:methylase of polypeptide subunit release factors
MECHFYKFKNYKIPLIGGGREGIGVSQSSQLLAEIIPPLQGLEVIDLGCGIGYMSIGALFLGAKKVIAVDIKNVEKILRKNIELNHFKQNQLIFIKSDLFSNVPPEIKCDVIIGNLPQHALPSTPLAKMLTGKYGGYDGTDLICRALTEGAYYLRTGGKFFGAISKLTNYQRTKIIAETIYKIKIHKKIQKTLRKNEMKSYVNDFELLNHLKKLKKLGIIEYTGDGIKQPIKYVVELCEFIKRKSV